MAHQIYFNFHGKASMAYVEDEPWHGLGQKLTPDAPRHVWLEESGMNFTINSSPLAFLPAGADPVVYPNRVALYRGDTNEPLSIVGDSYHVVQPEQAFDFVYDLCRTNNFQMETAGVLFRGQKYWALAKTGQGIALPGGDEVSPYLLIATACDGTMKTTAQLTSIRVVCNNTLSAAVGDRSSGKVKVSHRTRWTLDKATEVRAQLGIDDKWGQFVETIREMARYPLNDVGAARFIANVYAPNPEQAYTDDTAVNAVTGDKTMYSVFQLFNGKGRGAGLDSAKGTLWGAVNAVTEFTDHFAGRSQERRLDRAWFTSTPKDAAMNEALALLAA